MTKFLAALKPAAWSALFAFTAIFLAALFGWVNELLTAVSAGQVVIPDVAPLGKAFLASVGAALTGLVNFLFRYAQELGLLGGKTPVYTPTQEG